MITRVKSLVKLMAPSFASTPEFGVLIVIEVKPVALIMPPVAAKNPTPTGGTVNPE